MTRAEAVSRGLVEVPLRISRTEAVARGLVERRRETIDDYCTCGRSHLWDDRCPVCGKRPYTD